VLKKELFQATFGRDKGKVFVLTEMPALKAEKWALRGVMALAKAGVEIDPDGGGMAAIAVAGLKALQKLDYPEVEPLLDEMLDCVEIQPSPNVVRPLMRNGAEGDDIEEIRTIWDIRERVFSMHTSFFFQESE
jgi:hypothetical protein